VESVDIDMDRQSVIVRGYVDRERVLRKVRKVKQTATFWDSSHDYANYRTGAYSYYPPVLGSYNHNDNHPSRTPTYEYADDYRYNSQSESPSSYDTYDAYRYR
jgi:hypothetical protein